MRASVQYLSNMHARMQAALATSMYDDVTTCMQQDKFRRCHNQPTAFSFSGHVVRSGGHGMSNGKCRCNWKKTGKA
ncbi:hypothetical protein XFF6166_290016 [Xanthomonas citri pv. fuscans]|nr:hypothetical protein XFF6166_290016 [Xanthomonas citri pv. fuscans]SOO00525.1 hypothetical protein XFF6960_330015 [Xanthomonas citri pv. fuscans]SOO04122.1 hypothetical protein XFF7767_230011 [Xanthomonas citri pv. fuscans]SOO10127.1 hypothetical protein XFF6970_50008 [Xanthomonas citri pv. fuscans]SOO14835.1 hypothetical protein XFF7766_40014 [Xanthomonas citri pv. fuscans]